MALAAIALGSNLPGSAGSREANLDGGVAALAALGTVVAHSTWLETDPVGYADQPPFLNGAALLATELTPNDLLRALLGIELRFGRDRSHGIDKGPRTLDLDLLLYGDQVEFGNVLTLPHPAMHLRRFVLAPLAEIAPALVHPLLHRTVAQLLAALPEGVS